MKHVASYAVQESGNQFLATYVSLSQNKTYSLPFIYETDANAWVTEMARIETGTYIAMPLNEVEMQVFVRTH